MKGLYSQVSSSPTPVAASMRAVLAAVAVDEWELRHFDIEQAYLQADTDNKIHTGLPEDYDVFPIAVRLLKKAIYDW